MEFYYFADWKFISIGTFYQPIVSQCIERTLCVDDP
jgi:hypothetical protein